MVNKSSFLVAAFILILIIVVGFVAWTKFIKQPISAPNADQTQQINNQTTSPGSFSFANPKKSAHYESNTPAHGEVLAGVPINVALDFNFDLAKPSETKILKDGADFGIGETIIDSNKLAMRRNVKADAPDGVYTVEYKACWPDKSCHDGNFQFAIDRGQAQNYEEMTGKKEVTVNLSD